QLKAEQRVTIARFSLLPLRERAKKSVRSYIHRRVENKGASSFLSALFTGDLEERLMRQEFCRLGLAHLLAISGFHFAIFVLFCRLLLSFLPLKPRIFALLLLVTTYFIFLGNSASVQRAFFFSIIALLSQLLERDGNALNTLGGALLIAVVTDPFSLKSLSLQLSFLATLGILLFYRPYREKLLEVVKLSPMKQLLAICRTLFLRACSLNLAVHLMIVPLLLYHFHTFSVHTLLYNLLFPFFVSISLLLLMAGFLLPFLHPLNSLYTSALLFAIENPPLLLPSIYFENFSIWAVVIPLLLLFVWGIVRQHAIEGT
ncbi:MAG: ComEC/Rec2 family competence protein, partial [Chlamydiae bacterium]|nr:ComEC/Rec2 family competence protein [Chlamydiota bacterium]